MNYEKLKTFKEKEIINAIIETPKGSRNKYSYKPRLQIFQLDKILPFGAMFPFNFGFIPRTRAGDGDPLDVIVIMDDAAFPGCLISCRLLGVIKATQTENGKTVRNDRVIAVPADSATQNDLKTIKDINQNIISEIENFFISYHLQRGVEFKPLTVAGVKAALQIIKAVKK